MKRLLYSHIARLRCSMFFQMDPKVIDPVVDKSYLQLRFGAPQSIVLSETHLLAVHWHHVSKEVLALKQELMHQVLWACPLILLQQEF